MQLRYFAYRKSKDDGIGDDIRDPESVPKGVAVGATSLDGFVPECSNRHTLKYGCKRGSGRPDDDNPKAAVTKPFEIFGDEYAKIEAQHRDLVEAENQLVKYLGNVKPL